MPEFCESLFHQGLLSHQEAGPGSPENNEVPTALPTQVLTLPRWNPALPPFLIHQSPLTLLFLRRMRELKQNQELEGLPQPGLAT